MLFTTDFRSFKLTRRLSAIISVGILESGTSIVFEIPCVCYGTAPSGPGASTFLVYFDHNGPRNKFRMQRLVHARHYCVHSSTWETWNESEKHAGTFWTVTMVVVPGISLPTNRADTLALLASMPSTLRIVSPRSSFCSHRTTRVMCCLAPATVTRSMLNCFFRGNKPASYRRFRPQPFDRPSCLGAWDQPVIRT